MSRRKLVLVVAPPDESLSGVMEELDDLGFRVVWVPTLVATLELLRGHLQCSLIVVSAAAGALGGEQLASEVRRLSPDLRILWGVRSGSPEQLAAAPARRGLDRLIPEPFRGAELRNAISELLAEHFYPRTVTNVVESAALQILAPAGAFAVEGSLFLVADQNAFDVGAIIQFNGTASGHLMVGVTRADAEALYCAFVQGERVMRIDRIEDLIGELCNQILGRINAFLIERGFAISQGTPMFIRSPGVAIRYPSRHPSFAVTLSNGRARVDLEYCLAELDRERLEAPPTSRVLAVGEILYF